MSGWEIADGRMAESDGDPAEPPGAVGVFETLALVGGRARFFDRHMARFSAGCAHFGLGRAPQAPVLLAAAAELAAAGCITSGVIRWSAWKLPDEREGWRIRIDPPRPHTLKPSWRAAVSEVRLPAPGPGTPFKHLARQAWGEARAAGRAAGFDEVLLADSAGNLIEGAASNLFAVFGGRLRTPPLAAGPLPGIARSRVLAAARDLGLAAEEAAIARIELAAADEIFMTNSLTGPQPVSEIDGRLLPVPGPVAALLKEAWDRS